MNTNLLCIFCMQWLVWVSGLNHWICGCTWRVRLLTPSNQGHSIMPSYHSVRTAFKRQAHFGESCTSWTLAACIKSWTKKCPLCLTSSCYSLLSFLKLLRASFLWARGFPLKWQQYEQTAPFNKGWYRLAMDMWMHTNGLPKCNKKLKCPQPSIHLPRMSLKYHHKDILPF